MPHAVPLRQPAQSLAQENPMSMKSETWVGQDQLELALNLRERRRLMPQDIENMN